MHDIQSALVLLPLLTPAVTAILNMASGRSPNLRETWSILGASVTFLAVLALLPHVAAGGTYSLDLFELIPGASIKLRVDGMSLLFAGTSSFLWILAGFYCVGYMRGLNEHAQTRFYTCYSATIFGAVGVAFSGSLLTLYLFYEVVSIFTYPLVMHHQDADAYDGSRKYLTYLMTTSKALLLPAMVLVYVTAGTLDFAGSIGPGIFPATASRALVTTLYFMSIFGYAKAAIMPLHNWLPSAMVAPTPVSALLHAVAVVKVGVFSICRVMLYVFGVDLLHRWGLGLITAYLAAFTILTGSIIALTKDNLKARLAYSTISQLSYIVLGVALLTPSGIAGGLIHIPNHAFSKITLFFCAGAIMVAHRKTEISQMEGIGYQMPFTMAAFGLASLSMIGVPPVAGFVSKWFLALGAMELKSAGILVVLLVSSILNAGYFVPIFVKAFFPRNGAASLRYAEASPFMVVPLFLTSVLSVVFGFYPDLFLKLIEVVK
ncbi:MAG: monovalent cation/H+ antiporter subunit D family protein [Deltaproteobacteria bacterium]|nr:monovalent cation/H+ antiporter subunit D family protein [Deltaproteobacteria bacterium]